jgi:tRNA pseudouridine55 synthase
VRSLAAELGRALGVPAHLAALRRTAASGFTLDQAVALDALERTAGEAGPDAVRPHLVPPALALRDLPEVRVAAAEALDLAHGRAIPTGGALRSPPVPPLAPVQPHPAGPALARAVDDRGRLVAVCAVSQGRLRPVRVFLTAAEAATSS